MRFEVILPRNEMRGDITDLFYRTLSMHEHSYINPYPHHPGNQLTSLVELHLERPECRGSVVPDSD